MTDLYLEPVQSRTEPPTAYETKLAGAIEEVFGTGRHDLAGLVAGLNDLGMPSPSGVAWDEAGLLGVLERLGA